MGCGSSVDHPAKPKPQETEAATATATAPAKGNGNGAPAESDGNGNSASSASQQPPVVKVITHEPEETVPPTADARGAGEAQHPSGGKSPRLSVASMQSRTHSYGALSSVESAPVSRSGTSRMDVPKGDDKVVRVASLAKQAATILSDTTSRGVLRHPTVATMPDGSPVLDGFRHVFRKLEKDMDGVVTPHKLEVALQAWALVLPDAARTRIAFVVTDIFAQLDAEGDGAITWEQFEKWLEGFEKDIGEEDEEVLAQLFDLCDADGTGTIDAQELMDALLLMANATTQGTADAEVLTPEMAEAIVRDLDCKGTGGISLSEFTEVIHASWAKRERVGKKPTIYTSGGAVQLAADGRPHLVLNFDINQTVLMVDSCTGAGSENLCSTVIANAAWGVIEEDAEGKPSRWVLKCPEVMTYASEEGLHTYKEFVDLTNPLVTNEQGEIARERDKTIKARRRTLLWTFTEPGQPGEALHPKLLEMQANLTLPESLRGTDKAVAAGLNGDSYSLLPSFLHMMRELKRQQRSFTLFFRTFGNDMMVVLRELNALCEGRHPLFPEEDPIVLDGSDGKPDYRMSLTPDGCGTFFRNPPEDVFALIMGTIAEPGKGQGLEFYRGMRDDVTMFEGFHDACAKATELGSHRRTIALRDSYLGWSVVGSNSCGGKPFFLSDLNDPCRHSIFFDDNITATDPRIVDPIDPSNWPRRLRSSQLNGVHLIQAQPVDSITKHDYFLDCIRDCEKAREAKLQRWELVQRLLGDLAQVRQVLGLLVKEQSSIDTRADTNSSLPPLHTYRSWRELDVVKRSPESVTFDDHAE